LWLSQRKAVLSLVPVTSLFIFLILPVLGYSKVAQSDQEIFYSPKTNYYNSQTLSLLNSKERPNPKGATGGADPIESKDGALVPDISPITDANPEVVDPSGPKDISVYTVRPGDTLGAIADMFGVKTATIRGFNNIRKDSDLKPGMELLILPIDGISYKVAKGDTLQSVAKKFATAGDDVTLIAADISLFNDLPEDGVLTVGDEIIIPNTETDVSAPESPAPKPKPTPKPSPSTGGKGYFVKAWGGIMTQDFHDTYRARDFGMPIGSKIGASAAGRVIAANAGGWGGGYGSFIIIQHGNGAQTLYAHLSKVLVHVGEQVDQRQTIGLSGNTGRSTGPHLHFEIRHWGDIPFK
jgi:murein DD-endopeptidase MepM/ murein hydrolase activator NlpD